MSDLITKEDAPSFSEKELELLNKHVKDKKPNIAPSAASNFLALYLEGRSVDQIHQRFPQWDKGALLHARHFYKWDEAKQNHIVSLSNAVAERLTTAKSEIVQHLLDMLAVTHKEFAHQMEIYLQNPSKENLPRNRIRSSKEYRDIIKTLQDIIKVDEKGVPPVPAAAIQVNVQGSGAHINQEGNATVIDITTNEHEEVLDKLLEAKDGDKEPTG